MKRDFQKSNPKRDREIYQLRGTEDERKMSFKKIAEKLSQKYPKFTGERARQLYLKYLKKINKKQVLDK